MKIYPRRLTPALQKEIKKTRIVVLTGMRQVGKTTLMRDTFNKIQSTNKIFLDLTNPLNQKIFEEKNYDNIIANLESLGVQTRKRLFVFLDEVQVMPEIVKSIKYLHDHYDIKFFLTGSSSFYLKNLFPESLSGRKVIYELFPLDFQEYLVFKDKPKNQVTRFSNIAKGKNTIVYEMYKAHYQNYLMYGGFPAVVLERDVTRKRQILEDIFKSYFEKDVKTLSDFKNISKLRDLILVLANRVGSKIDVSKIASEIGTARETIYSYLSFLENTYFISLLSPFSKSINGEVRGAKKVYFCDCGLLNYIANVPEGILFENSVFLNLRKYGSLNYYARYKGAELDFILNKQIGFEAKIKAGNFDMNKLTRMCSGLDLREYYLVVKVFADISKAILAQDL
ncbi:MAG: ATP-binding protein [candidate division WOR-3 bacterium]